MLQGFHNFSKGTHLTWVRILNVNGQRAEPKVFRREANELTAIRQHVFKYFPATSQKPTRFRYHVLGNVALQRLEM